MANLHLRTLISLKTNIHFHRQENPYFINFLQRKHVFLNVKLEFSYNDAIYMDLQLHLAFKSLMEYF